MIPEARWERVKELMGVAIALPSGRRAAFLEAECGGDPALREELESLLRAHEQAGDFLPPLTQDPPHAGDDEDEPPVGRRVGPYRLLSLIGRGGMGDVYRAVRDDDHFKKLVAVKLVRCDIAGEPVLRRFRAERQILARLEHPGIARLLDGGATEDGRPFLVMEHVEGVRIDAYAAGRRLDVRARLELFRQVCAAVAYAHQQRIVHRDLKPANILVSEEGTPKLLDFGIAKLLDPADASPATATVWAPLTPEYASPEQLWGEPVGPASDVYSLGVILYEVLAGQRPYRVSGSGPVEMTRLLRQEEPPRPSTAVTEATASTVPGATPARLRRSLQGDLDTIVLKALRKEPSRRYHSVEALAEDVGRHLAGLPVHARPDTFTYRAGKFIRRHRATLAWATLVACLAGAVVAAIERTRLGRGAAAPLAGPALRTVPFTSSAGREENPAFSPDGKLLAYDWSAEGRHADVYVQGLGGEAPVQLTSNPDSECCPAFSRDGGRIAFLRLNRSGVEVLWMPTTGGGERRVTRLKYGDPTGLDWSPDGWLAVVYPRAQGHGIFAVSPDGGEPRRLTSPADGELDTQPCFSPDGRTLAFLRRIGDVGKGVFILALDGPGRPRPIVPGDWQVRDVAWAADSRSLLFTSGRAGQEGLWRVPLGDGSAEPLPLVAGSERSSPTVSLQGDRLAYTLSSSDTNIWRVRARGRAGANPPEPWIKSTRDDSSPQYSPDGRRIAFLSNRSGSREVWVCDADGSNPVQVTASIGRGFRIPRWSPDGRWLAFDANPRGGSSDVFVLDPEGGRPRPLVEGPADDRMPSWSRDGKWVYFATNPSETWMGGWEGWRIWKVPSSGGTPVAVTQAGTLAPLESSDGRFLYFIKVLPTEPKQGIWRIPVAGGVETRVDNARPVGWSHWTLASDGFYLVSGEGQPPRFFIDFLPFSGGPSARIAALDRPIADHGLTVSPDGRWLLYGQSDRRESDIMLVENFR